ncbi:hypothetical protein DCCM_2978 [Desulfocucumis palustris]|uniref:Uncharacterized protein n=1 Tax=Desulfocucumis palustris TaxID=1898651 RepID=A0A2L2XC11_9FIRM|nr:hypothetical protein DCCM_2978 [Desulfocucumis palustris]
MTFFPPILIYFDISRNGEFPGCRAIHGYFDKPIISGKLTLLDVLCQPAIVILP